MKVAPDRGIVCIKIAPSTAGSALIRCSFRASFPVSQRIDDFHEPSIRLSSFLETFPYDTLGASLFFPGTTQICKKLAQPFFELNPLEMRNIRPALVIERLPLLMQKGLYVPGLSLPASCMVKS